MEDTFSIHLTIADRRYPLRIKRSEEEEALVRAAAKLVNDWLTQYRNRFKVEDAGLEMRDLLAMAACQIAIRALKAEQNEDGKAYASTIGQLDKELLEILG
jgi:hypothetical protein